MSKDAKSLSAKIAQGEKTSPPQSEKEEKIINNLAGKRVNYSARTVISPDPSIKINEV